MKYDKEKTQKYKQSSMFECCGFIEVFFEDGKLIGEQRHAAIPWGRDLGSPGEKIFWLERPTKFETRYKKAKTYKSGTKITTRIDAICGRIKGGLIK